MSGPAKTNAARLLDSLGVAYELRSYEVNPADLTAAAVARKIGMPVEQVFKTLLVRLMGAKTDAGAGEYVFGVVAGDAELDLKKLAAMAQARKAELAALKDVEPLTGYVRGGVTVMAARKRLRAFADETLEMFEAVSVSAGQRGLQIVLAPADYLRATDAVVADLSKPLRTAGSPPRAADGEAKR